MDRKLTCASMSLLVLVNDVSLAGLAGFISLRGAVSQVKQLLLVLSQFRGTGSTFSAVSLKMLMDIHQPECVCISLNDTDNP